MRISAETQAMLLKLLNDVMFDGEHELPQEWWRSEHRFNLAVKLRARLKVQEQLTKKKSDE